MLSNIFSVAKKQTDNADGNVTVILTVWKRNYLEEQIEAIINQTVRPYQVWIYQCGDFVNTKKLRRIFPNIQWINSSINLKYFGRFSLAVYAKSDYVWILDDDVIRVQFKLSLGSHCVVDGFNLLPDQCPPLAHGANPQIQHLLSTHHTPALTRTF